MGRFVLDLVVFVCGAAVMVFELTGSRVLAPYAGTSIFVWASLIGIILGSLSVGYWSGGRLADRRPAGRVLSLVILASAVLIAASALAKRELLVWLYVRVPDLRWRSILASAALFSLPSWLLGMVSPYAARLRMKSLDATGKTVGSLYAISTLGSIAGTFLAGFFLIPHFGSTRILYILAGTLVATSMLLVPRRRAMVNGVALAVVALLGWGTAESGAIKVETLYNSVWIGDYRNAGTGRVVRVMSLNSQNSSTVFLDSDELVEEYTKYYNLAAHFDPGFHSALMIGGAGYVYPREYLRRFPGATLDVVEIDPMVTELAREYFGLEDDPRLGIYHQDARIFLNETAKKYDLFFGDVFQSIFSVPFHLTTRETAERVYGLLPDNGVVILNTISSIEGSGGKFLRALFLTYRAVFPQVYLLPVDDPADGRRVQNVMLVALKTRTPPPWHSDDPELERYLAHRWTREVPADVPPLTDDHAPVEYYLGLASRR
jgi:spermidine synthase